MDTKKVNARRVLSKQSLHQTAIPVEVVTYELHRLIDMWAAEATRHRPVKAVSRLPSITWAESGSRLDLDYFEIVTMEGEIEVADQSPDVVG